MVDEEDIDVVDRDTDIYECEDGLGHDELAQDYLNLLATLLSLILEVVLLILK